GVPAARTPHIPEQLAAGEGIHIMSNLLVFALSFVAVLLVAAAARWRDRHLTTRAHPPPAPKAPPVPPPVAVSSAVSVAASPVKRSERKPASHRAEQAAFDDVAKRILRTRDAVH